MIGLYRMMQRRAFVIPWILALILGSVACEGPYTQHQKLPPDFRPTQAPVIGSVVYQEGMSGVLEKAYNLVQKLETSYSQTKASELDMLPFRLLQDQSRREHKLNIEGFDQLESDMRARDIDQEMLDRLQKQREEYTARYQIFVRQLERFVSQPETWGERVVMLEQFKAYLRGVVRTSSQIPLDPNNLPYSRIAPVSRNPIMDTKSYAQWLGLPELPEGTPIAAPTADDLKETKEIKITPEIKVLADKLKTPVEIYRWVRDNIEFYPNYGSIQGADYCRMTKRCNSHDTASLLIALLRSQQIPARYVFGTVEVPIAEARNWVGRFDEKSGALVGRALASAGIPAVSLFTGKEVESIRLEHVWVEAWVDYVPSQGRVHVEGDTWIPMDASFKQYKYSAPTIDMAKATGFNGQKTIDDAKKAVKADADDAIISPPDATVIENAIKLSGSNLDKATQQDGISLNKVAGDKEILSFAHNVLLAALPYEVKVIGQRQAEMPDRMRHYMNLSVITQVAPSGPWGWGGDPSPDFQVRISLAEVAGKQLSLAYNPASQSDQAAIEKYVTSAQSDPKTLPKSLPSVIRVKPAIMLDNKELAIGQSVQLGADNRFNIDVTGPGINKRINNTIVAGSFNAVVVNHGAIANEYLQQMRTRALELRKQFDEKTVKSVQREEIFGAYLHSAGLGYWVTQDQNNFFLANRMGVLDIRQPAIGLFSYGLSTTYSGFIVATPRSVSGGGMSTDIDHDPHAVISYSDDADTEIGYMSASGLSASAWEASIWEAMLRPNAPNANNGVSATHMMLYAAQTGVPIYTIDKSNVQAVIPKLSLTQATINDIRSAVAAGKKVMAPQKQMTKGNWKGVGYIIIDGKTGAGAYMISGGNAGGGNDGDSSWLLSFLAGMLMIGAGIFASGLFAFVLAALGIAAALIDIFSSYNSINNSNLTDSQRDTLKGLANTMFAIGVAIALLGITFGAIGAFVAVAIYVLILSIFMSKIIEAILGITENVNRRNDMLKDL